MESLQPRNLDVQMRWNLRPPVSPEADPVRMAISHYESRNVVTLKALIQEQQGSVPRSFSALSKFSYCLMALTGIKNGRHAKALSNLRIICSNPLRMAAVLSYLYEIYEHVLTPEGNLPNIPQFQTAAMERATLTTLPEIQGSFPSEIASLYSYSTAFYLIWAAINVSSDGNGTHSLEFHRDRFENILQLPASGLPAPQQQTPQQQTQQQRAVPGRTQIHRLPLPVYNITEDPLCHLKQTYMEMYQNAKMPQECVICLETMTYDSQNINQLRLTDCGHMFHTACLARWRKHQCPTCRKPTTRNSLRRLAQRQSLRLG